MEHFIQISLTKEFMISSVTSLSNQPMTGTDNIYLLRLIQTTFIY